MSLTEFCSHCGFYNSAHSANCPRVFVPQPTAYDREQHALRERVAAIEAHANEIAATATRAIGRLADRLNAALQRIEQLELAVAKGGGYTPAGSAHVCGACRTDHQVLADRLGALEADVARLKGPQSPYAQAIDQKLENIRNTTKLILGTDEATHLGCGCPAPLCQGHQFDRFPATALKSPNDGWCRCAAHAGPHMHQVAASPATAYPPLTDEGT